MKPVLCLCRELGKYFHPPAVVGCVPLFGEGIIPVVFTSSTDGWRVVLDS